MVSSYISNYGALSMLENNDSIRGYDKRTKKWLNINKDLEEILLLCQGRLTIEEIINKISGNHNISEQKIRKKILSSINSLEKDQIIIKKEKQEDRTIRVRNYNFEFPLISAFIEITKKCNLNCSHCYNESSNREHEGLSRKDLSNFLEQVDKMGVFNIFLTGGEPFIRKDFMDILYEINDRKMEIGILTNGILLNKDSIKELSKIKPKFLAVSLESLNEEKYRIIRRVNNKKVIDNILKMKNQEINVKINTVLFNGLNDSYVDIKSLLLFLKEKGFNRNDLAIDEFLNIGRGKKFDKYVIKDKAKIIENYKRASREIFNEEASLETHYGNQNRTSFCGLGENILYLTSNADITLCTVLTDKKFMAGNIREKPLKEIWEKSDKFNYFRERKHIKNSECENCSKLSECAGGCKAKPMLLEGHFNMADKWACSFYA